MGLVLARQEAERLDIESSHNKAMEFIQTHRPDYLGNGEVLGFDLSPSKRKNRRGSMGVFSMGSGDSTPSVSDRGSVEGDDKEDEPNGTFINACRKGRYWQVEFLALRNIAFVDIPDSRGCTGLYRAAEAGHEKVVKTLVNRHSASVDLPNRFGWTPLMAAVFHGHVKVIEYLLKAGASVGCEDLYGCGVLHFASSSPKLYVGDFVSRRDRVKRRKVRQREFARYLMFMSLKQGAQQVADGDGEPVAPVPKKRRGRWTKAAINKIQEIRERMVLGEDGGDGIGAKGSHLQQLRELAEREKRRAGVQSGGTAHRPLSSSSTSRPGTAETPLAELFADMANLSVEQQARQLWVYYPNRIELIVIDRLLKLGKFGRRQKVTKKDFIDKADKKGRTPLSYAATYGHEYIASRLLYEGAKIDSADRQGRTPLMHAVSNEHLAVVEVLLNSKADVNASDITFKSPLHLALEARNSTMAEILLSYGADVNAFDASGKTPLMIAMDQKASTLFNQVLLYNPSLDALDERGWNVLIYAVRSNLLDGLLPVLRRLTKEELTTVTRWQDPRGYVALHHAVEMGKLNEVETLRNMDPDTLMLTDCFGNTPLHVAAINGNMEILNCLATHFDDLDVQNNIGESPLQCAAHGGHIACVVALLSPQRHLLPASADHVDFRGKTLLMHACNSGNSALVRMLLLNESSNNRKVAFGQAKVNAQDANGLTALMLACVEGYWQLIAPLALAGGNILSTDNDGWAPLHYACDAGEVICAASILDLGEALTGRGQGPTAKGLPLSLDAVLNQRDKQGWTPLMHAASKGHMDCAQLLLDRRANVDIKAYSGHNAIAIAKSSEHDLVIEAILDAIRNRSGELASTDKLCRGVSNADGFSNNREKPNADGHFMITILQACDLFAEGMSTDHLNVYVCIQFCPSRADGISIAITSCCLKTDGGASTQAQQQSAPPAAAPQGDAGIAPAVPGTASQPMPVLDPRCGRFDTRCIDHEGWLTVELYAVDASDPTNLTFGNSLGPRDDVMVSCDIAAATCKGLSEVPPEKRVEAAVSQAYERRPASENKREHREVEEPTTITQIAATDLMSRRKLAVLNARLQLSLGGFADIPEPPVPLHKGHIPLGFVFLPFAHLREATVSADPIRIDRALRANVRGRIAFEVDFRPRLWNVTTGRQRELDEPYFSGKGPISLRAASLDGRLPTPRPEHIASSDDYGLLDNPSIPTIPWGTLRSPTAGALSPPGMDRLVASHREHEVQTGPAGCKVPSDGGRRSIIHRVSGVKDTLRNIVRRGHSDVKSIKTKQYALGASNELEKAGQAKRATIFAIKDALNPRMAG
ncbi:Ankyrin Repeat [Perkinsus chesapeaki]|uniref:Ankyrin Repeat n=1 Tax=Perkinsus chesapeaki TaxID=330153 RepID=A0A7J6MV15_PERCH|nr:Ankyrin Repeat [Perkinsus chesapeaki]